MLKNLLCTLLLLAASSLSASVKIDSVTISGVAIAVEIADTPELRSRGLMQRASLPPDTGMLFVYVKPRKVSFWMKNTLMNLDIAYIAEDGTIFQIETMKKGTTTSHPSALPIKWALEVPAGYFAAKNIAIGQRMLISGRE